MVTDFLQDEAELSGFQGSETTTDFIKKVGMAFETLAAGILLQLDTIHLLHEKPNTMGSAMW